VPNFDLIIGMQAGSRREAGGKGAACVDATRMVMVDLPDSSGWRLIWDLEMMKRFRL
jgi:hypothetical protein